MSYTTQKQMEQYIDNFYECDTETFISEFEWLVRAVISDPTHARESLIDAIKSHTKDSEDDACDMLYGVDNNQ
jgi:hypothetical protein